MSLHFFKYHHTNCYFLENAAGDLLALDAGWPGTLREYQREMKAIGLGFERIRWAAVTHFHMDHAGLISEFVTAGISCFVFETQVEAIDSMEKTIRKNLADYPLVDRSRLKVVQSAEARELFGGLGFDLDVLRTDAHSPDSLTFLTGTGEAIIGDLTPLDLIMADDHEGQASWKLILDRAAVIAYPSHAPTIDLCARS